MKYKEDLEKMRGQSLFVAGAEVIHSKNISAVISEVRTHTHIHTESHTHTRSHLLCVLVPVQVQGGGPEGDFHVSVLAPPSDS